MPFEDYCNALRKYIIHSLELITDCLTDSFWIVPYSSHLNIAIRFNLDSIVGALLFSWPAVFIPPAMLDRDPNKIRF